MIYFAIIVLAIIVALSIMSPFYFKVRLYSNENIMYRFIYKGKEIYGGGCHRTSELITIPFHKGIVLEWYNPETNEVYATKELKAPYSQNSAWDYYVYLSYTFHRFKFNGTREILTGICLYGGNDE